MKLIASLLLAGAIAAMHFTGMAALVLSVPAGTPLELQASADSLRLGWLTGVLASAIAACGIWAAWSEKQRERRLSETAGSTPCSTSSTTPTPRCARWLATTA